MAQIDLTNPDAIRAERDRLSAQVEAYDMILAGLDRLSGSTTGETFVPTGSTANDTIRRSREAKRRVRRTQAEVDAIKTAAIESATTAPGKKTVIFDRLVADGVVSDDRRDSELVLRTLKEASEGPGAVLDQGLDGTFGPASAQEPHLRGVIGIAAQ